MGRIQRVYPGTDGLVRAVDVYIKGKELRKRVTRLVKLYKDMAHGKNSEGLSWHRWLSQSCRCLHKGKRT